ncbi:MAG TPA: NAD(P)-dependent oxidoreductase [Polyangiaceae bacterium]|nr:NAD(P)-dependent oxidoreductase [Polyangiaceae bacterium]
MRILVTGAAGKLGSEVVSALARAGHDVHATDLRFRDDLAVPLVLANLLDEHALHPLVAGCDALVHLGNHPNRFAGPSPQRLLAENTSMNANAFFAALDAGVKHIVFASSVQAMIPVESLAGPPYRLPYLPLDGHAPPNPGLNPYALSKELAENMLRVAARAKPELCVTSLRYPMLIGDWFRVRLAANGGRVPSAHLHLGEATGHLSFEDGARLVVHVLERPRPGYRQYFPAQTVDVKNVGARGLIERFYPDIELRRPLAAIDRLVDLGELEQDLGFTPTERLSVELAEG